MYTNNLNLKVNNNKSNEPWKVLIISNLSSFHSQVRSILANDYHLIQASTHNQALAFVNQNLDIKCFVIDAQADHYQIDSIAQLKSHFLTYHISIILVVKALLPTQLTYVVTLGVDDFINRSLISSELIPRLALNIARTKHNQNTNPLTKLPSSEITNKVIIQRLNKPLAILYVDLDRFKAFNDYYGYVRGDDILQATAQLLINTTLQMGNSNDFIGNIGGDDFIIITTPDKSDSLAQAICSQFDQHAPLFYDEIDRKNGKIITYNRQGVIQEFPIISLSIAIVHNQLRTLKSIAQIAQLMAELKRYAKSKPGNTCKSNFVKDRRSENKFVQYP